MGPWSWCTRVVVQTPGCPADLVLLDGAGDWTQVRVSSLRVDGSRVLGVGPGSGRVTLWGRFVERDTTANEETSSRRLGAEGLRDSSLQSSRPCRRPSPVVTLPHGSSEGQVGAGRRVVAPRSPLGVRVDESIFLFYKTRWSKTT